MSRQRYELITAFLHFNDNTKMKARGEEGYDSLYKIRRLLHIMDPLFMKHYCPKWHVFTLYFENSVTCCVFVLIQYAIVFVGFFLLGFLLIFHSKANKHAEK